MVLAHQHPVLILCAFNVLDLFPIGLMEMLGELPLVIVDRRSLGNMWEQLPKVSKVILIMLICRGVQFDDALPVEIVFHSGK